MTFVRICALLIPVLFIVACSDVPSERKIAQLLQQQADDTYEDLITIDDVNKLNGWAENEQQYTVEVTYTVNFQKSFKDYVDEQTDKPGNPLEKVASGIAAGVLKLQYGDFKAGDQYKVKQQALTLRKTEQGWALQQSLFTGASIRRRGRV